MPLKIAMSKTLQFAVGGFLIGVLTFMLTTCICAHLPRHALLGTVPGALMTWYAFFTSKESRLFPRLSVWACVILTTFLVLKNIHNVLWSGHNALFS